MKLKRFLKLVYKVYKKCGDVDIEFYDSKGNDIELESIGHFNFVMDVTMTFKQVLTDKTLYHITCNDCGQFLKKDRWVRKDDPNKFHGLCSDCYNCYDDPRYL